MYKMWLLYSACRVNIIGEIMNNTIFLPETYKIPVNIVSQNENGNFNIKVAFTGVNVYNVPIEKLKRVPKNEHQ